MRGPVAHRAPASPRTRVPEAWNRDAGQRSAVPLLGAPPARCRPALPLRGGCHQRRGLCDHHLPTSSVACAPTPTRLLSACVHAAPASCRVPRWMATHGTDGWLDRRQHPPWHESSSTRPGPAGGLPVGARGAPGRWAAFGHGLTLPVRIGDGDTHYGGVANVDRDGNNALSIKARGAVISTFATRPTFATPPLRHLRCRSGQ